MSSFIITLLSDVLGCTVIGTCAAVVVVRLTPTWPLYRRLLISVPVTVALVAPLSLWLGLLAGR